MNAREPALAKKDRSPAQRPEADSPDGSDHLRQAGNERPGRFTRLLVRADARSTEEYFLDTMVPALYRSYPELAAYYSDHEQRMLVYALWWAHHGWRVFPTRGKVPAIASPHPKGSAAPCKGTCGQDGHGHHDATHDMEKVRRWWMGPCRGCDISVVVPDHILCLDIDPRHGGDLALAALEELHGTLPDTLEVVSGRGDGGRHLFFRRCLGELNATIGDGVEIKHVSVMPPSRHDETGNPYELIERKVADSPGWLCGGPSSHRRRPNPSANPDRPTPVPRWPRCSTRRTPGTTSCRRTAGAA